MALSEWKTHVRKSLMQCDVLIHNYAQPRIGAFDSDSIGPYTEPCIQFYWCRPNMLHRQCKEASSSPRCERTFTILQMLHRQPHELPLTYCSIYSNMLVLFSASSNLVNPCLKFFPSVDLIHVPKHLSLFYVWNLYFLCNN